MNRLELQQLADQRIDDARLLLAASRWPAAYCLAGYALECALKSCVLLRIEKTGIIFEDKKYSEKCWTHNLEDLVLHAGLITELTIANAANPIQAKNWAVVTMWTETSRYKMSSQLDAENLFQAITDIPNGVLPWLKTYW